MSSLPLYCDILQIRSRAYTYVQLILSDEHSVY